MAVGTPTTSNGTSTTPAVAVPAGVASGDIVLLAITLDNASIAISTRWPSGFTGLKDAAGTKDGAKYGLAWKRLTGSDSGSYTLASGTSFEYAMTAIPLTGRHASTAPTISADSIDNTGGGSPLTCTALGVTAATGDDLIAVFFADVAVSGVGNGFGTYTAGLSEIVDLESSGGWCNLAAAKQENVSSGATGSKTTVFTLTSSVAGSAGWVVAFPVAAGGTDANVGAVPASSAGSAPVAVVSAAATGTVTAVPAVSAGSAPAAGVTAGVTVGAVAATSVGSAPPANQIISAVVGAPASVSLGSAPIASVSAGGSGATVSAVAAVSAGSVPLAVIRAGVAVTAVTATSAGSAPAAALTQGVTVVAVPASSAGSAPRPAITPAPVGGGGQGTVAATFAEESR